MRKKLFTWDKMMGPPCEAYSLSDFIMFTIFVVKFCMKAFHIDQQNMK